MDDLSFDHRVVIGLWVMWAVLVAAWLALSIYEYVVHNDAGSFIGGGIAMAFWTAIVAALHAATRRTS